MKVLRNFLNIFTIRGKGLFMRKVTQFFKRGNKKFLFRPLNIFT